MGYRVGINEREKYVIVLHSDHLHNHFTARRVVESILHAGHSILCIFFLFDAAYIANNGIDLASDEFNANLKWSELGLAYDIDLLVCSASALRRGITAEMLTKGFSLGSIGNLVELADLSNKVIQL